MTVLLPVADLISGDAGVSLKVYSNGRNTFDSGHLVRAEFVRRTQ